VKRETALLLKPGFQHHSRKKTLKLRMGRATDLNLCLNKYFIRAVIEF